MKTTIYIVCHRGGVDRITKRKPPVLAGGEVAVRLAIEIDDQNFRTPLAEAFLSIDERFVIHPDVSIELEEPDEDPRALDEAVLQG